MALIHASCVELKGRGILILGESGAGKSDLALRLIDIGARLVSDDYVEVINKNDTLLAKTAPNIAGMIEVRGVGLMDLDYLPVIQLDLVIELVDPKEIERLPEKSYFEQDDVKLPFYKFDAFAASAIAKIKLMVSKLD